jgi:hypothetical protein
MIYIPCVCGGKEKQYKGAGYDESLKRIKGGRDPKIKWS